MEVFTLLIAIIALIVALVAVGRLKSHVDGEDIEWGDEVKNPHR